MNCDPFAAKKANLWELHQLGATYAQRPSSILGITDSWLAYQIDVVTLRLGTWVEGKLEERDKEGKRIHTLDELLRDDLAEEQIRFASAKHLVVKKMKIPDSGVW
jgi:hypothetical protein